jgi:hypothetical protein
MRQNGSSVRCDVRRWQIPRKRNNMIHPLDKQSIHALKPVGVGVGWICNSSIAIHPEKR